MRHQYGLKLTVSPLPGESIRARGYRQKSIDGEFHRNHIPQEKLFCDLLKRLAREAMSAVTECPAVAMPHALARLVDVRETVCFALAHDLVPGSETLRSGAQLVHAHTLADFLECIELTRRDHRAPAFLNSRDTELAKLNDKIDLLAGLVSMALPAAAKMPAAFCDEEAGA